METAATRRVLKIRQAAMLKQAGLTNEQVATRMGCTIRSVQKYMAEYRADETQQIALTIQPDSLRMFDRTTTALLECIDASLKSFKAHERKAEQLGQPTPPAASAFLKTATAAATQLGQLFALPVIAARAAQVEERGSGYQDFLASLTAEVERGKRQAASIEAVVEPSWSCNLK